MKRLLLLDDDLPWLKRFASSFEKRGYSVCSCSSLKEAKEALNTMTFDYAVFDLKLEDGISLQLIEHAQKMSPAIHIILLTGYGNFATAVDAIKLGAVNYLAKPSDIEEIESCLIGTKKEESEAELQLLSPNRVKWEYIQRILSASNQNISKAARRLNMHRRTLQRILAKHAPR